MQNGNMKKHIHQSMARPSLKLCPGINLLVIHFFDQQHANR